MSKTFIHYRDAWYKDIVHKSTPIAVDGTMPEGTIAYGSFSVREEFIDNGSEITVTDNIVENIVEISQNLESERV